MINPMREIIDYLHARTLEYNAGNPTISDEEWDARYLQLQDLEKETGYVYPDSPTQHIDYEIVDSLNKYKHKYPMLSLGKTKSISDIQNYFEGQQYIAMTKLDGLSMSITYRNGELVSAATRGNGEIGEDITHNAKIISNIPQKIPCDNEIIINGEIICPKDVFDENFSSDYKNPRNFASGSIRLLNSKDCEARKLKFIAWDCVYGLEVETFKERLVFMDSLGFDVVDWVLLQGDFVIGMDFILKAISENHYPCDGIVCRFNDIALGDSLGNTAHHPNHSIAFKFIDEQVETVLEDIVYEPSRNGVLTPIAVFKPVELEGTIVSRASLHNISIVEKLSNGLTCKGDKLTIIKANQIIPQVIKWDNIGIFTPENQIWFPTVCPVCGEPIEEIISESGVKILKCSNEKCPSRLINQLDHFCGKKGFDIKGLSKATLDKLIDWGWVMNKIDIFNLNKYREEWIKKSGFGPKSVDNILNAIQASKNIDLINFIVSLGIPLVGTTVAKIIAKHENTYENFKKDVIDNDFHFSTLDGIGLEIDNSIKTFDYSEADEIYKIISIKINQDDDETQLNFIKGKRFAITGKIEYGRSALTDFIEKNGGTVTSTVSKKTDILIANQPEESAKYKNAVSYGTKIMTELEFFTQLEK